MFSWLRVFRGRGERSLFQIPAIDLNFDRLTYTATQGEDAGDKGHFRDGDPVRKTLTTAKERLVDRQHVLAIGRNRKIEHWVWMEKKVVVVRDFLAA